MGRGAERHESETERKGLAEREKEHWLEIEMAISKIPEYFYQSKSINQNNCQLRILWALNSFIGSDISIKSLKRKT